MTCPCHLVQTSLMNSLASTLTCPPSAADPRHCRPPTTSYARPGSTIPRVSGQNDTLRALTIMSASARNPRPGCVPQDPLWACVEKKRHTESVVRPITHGYTIHQMKRGPAAVWQRLVADLPCAFGDRV